jgi:hypothetical protein
MYERFVPTWIRPGFFKGIWIEQINSGKSAKASVAL